MAQKIFMLKDMLKQIGESECKKEFANFSCPHDPDLEFFLNNKAIEYERQEMSRTHLVYKSYKKKYVLAGYFALALTVVKINQSAPKSAKKRLAGHKTASEAPTFLIGQLSKNFTYPKNIIRGTDLLYLSYREIVKVYNAMGGRIVLVECKDEPYLRRFYEDNAFQRQDYIERANDLLKYTRRVKDIIEEIE